MKIEELREIRDIVNRLELKPEWSDKDIGTYWIDGYQEVYKELLTLLHHSKNDLIREIEAATVYSIPKNLSD